MKKEAESLDIRAHGYFAGEPGAPDAHAARRALLVVAKGVNAAAVLLIRDSDGDEQRVRGLQQARDERNWSFAVVIGVAHTRRECWLLGAFSPSNPQAMKKLGALTRELGIDPRLQSEQLTATDESAKRSAKRVLRALCGDDPARAERGIAETPLRAQRKQGQHNGLVAYLAELETRLVPLFQ